MITELAESSLHVQAKYEAVITELAERGEKQAQMCATAELGDILAHSGDMAGAAAAWNDALDLFTGPYQVCCSGLACFFALKALGVVLPNTSAAWNDALDLFTGPYQVCCAQLARFFEFGALQSLGVHAVVSVGCSDCGQIVGNNGGVPQNLLIPQNVPSFGTDQIRALERAFVRVIVVHL